MDQQQAAGLTQMMLQLGPVAQRLMNSIKPLIDQPVERFPFEMPLATSAIFRTGTSPLRAATQPSSMVKTTAEAIASHRFVRNSLMNIW